MARRPRHSLAGVTYHVMMKGNNGQSIFSSDWERQEFYNFMKEGVNLYGHQILAYCLMTNHVHLALQVADHSISKICQNLAFRYTRFYNKNHNAVGHLFQGRFKSIVVDRNRYLKELVRYIHLNPVRAKIVDNPLDYPWSSHQAYISKALSSWLSKDICLKLFGDTRLAAKNNFHNFVLSGINAEDGFDFENGCCEGILGDDKFIERIQKTHSNASSNPLISINLNTIVDFVARKYGIESSDLQNPGLNHQLSHIRSVIALIVRDIPGVKLRDFAIFCGRGESAMSQSAARLEIRMKTTPILKEGFIKLKTDLFRTDST